MKKQENERIFSHSCSFFAPFWKILHSKGGIFAYPIDKERKILYNNKRQWHEYALKRRAFYGYESIEFQMEAVYELFWQPAPCG
jgi:hypothetical protein